MKIRTYFVAAVMGLALQNIVFAQTFTQSELAAPSSHTLRQTRPILLGVSGGSTVDKSNGYCCSGTLGSLVKDSKGIYILSNTHVFAGDTAPSGNGKKSSRGDPINQPGYIDVNCQNRNADYVGNLERWIPLVANGTSTVDAAIAKTSTILVNSLGKIMGIGSISSTPRSAFIGQKVKKSGRTSGLTTGQVAAINATINVQYSTECNGTLYNTKFNNQILVTPGSFIQPGDSGSLLVENTQVNPRPVGLLFAGSSSVAVANPIQSVLNALKVSLVGTATPTSKITNFEKASQAAIDLIKNAQNKHGDWLLELKGVVGHAVSLSGIDEKTPVLMILVSEVTDDILMNLPTLVEGQTVEVMEVGNIRAY